MTEVVFISDYFAEDLIGGGELNDLELCILLSKKFKVSKIKSHDFTLDMATKKSFYIISNFINLNRFSMKKIQEECSYIIYEHDHKYLKSRNPCLFTNHKAPSSEIINQTFYQNAKRVFCQSSFHEKIINKNLTNVKTFNVSGNLWSDESIKLMINLSSKKKKDRYSVLNSSIKHKNTSETVFYCNAKGLEYELISSSNYSDFLSLLSNNKKFIFLPKTPETLSRVVVEAKMMNIKVTTNKLVGATYEPWFKLEGIKLINYMIENKKRIFKEIEEVCNVE